MTRQYTEHLASAKAARAARQDAWRARLRRAFGDHDAAVEHWADDCGVSHSRAHKSVSHEGGSEMQLGDVETLPWLVRKDIVEALAQTLGCTIAELGEAVDISSDVALLGRVAAQTGSAVAALGLAMADGRLDAVEAAEIDRKCTEAIQALAAVRLRARMVQRERVVGVRVLHAAPTPAKAATR